MRSDREDQFVQYKYPADGCSKIHMIWTDSPSWITCWNDGNNFIRAVRASRHRVHPVPASLDRERRPVRRRHPAGQHQAGRGRHRQRRLQRADGPALPGAALHRAAGRDRSATTRSSARSPSGWACWRSTPAARPSRSSSRSATRPPGVADKISWEELHEKGYYVVPPDAGLGEHPGRAHRVLRGPGEAPAHHAHRQARVLLHRPGRALPRRRGAAAGAQVDPQGRVAPGDPRDRAEQEVSAAGHEQPPALGRALPARRHHLVPGDRDLQDPRRPTATSTTRCG